MLNKLSNGCPIELLIPAAVALLLVALAYASHYQRILCIGDSTLYCRNAFFVSQNGFPERLARLTHASVLNEGICGATSKQCTLNLLARHSQESFDVIIIRVGINDAIQNKWSEPDFLQLIDNARKSAKRVIVVSPETMDASIELTRPDIDAAAKRAGIVPIVAGLTRADFLPGDKIHPIDSGCDKIAQAVSAAVAN